MKKAICIILSVLMFVLPLSIGAFAQETKKMVVLGDSIAWGTGVYNSKQASYARIVADTIGYDLVNYAKDGARSAEVLEQLQNGINEIRQADIIMISVGGNNYLQQNLLVLVPEILVGIDENMQNIENNFAVEFAQIIHSIKAVNPTALILVNRLYNPEYLLLGYIYGEAVIRVNRVIDTYYNENPDDIVLVDVSSYIENHPECVALDTIHPSAVGNVEIAGAILSTLRELDVTNADTLVVNTIGIDELPFTSYILKAVLDAFRLIFNKLKALTNMI